MPQLLPSGSCIIDAQSVDNPILVTAPYRLYFIAFYLPITGKGTPGAVICSMALALPIHQSNEATPADYKPGPGQAFGSHLVLIDRDYNATPIDTQRLSNIL
jgi:hypothetical protein